jgi:proline racemase
VGRAAAQLPKEYSMLKTLATFHAVDSHTLGQTTRVIMSGGPRLNGETILEQREDFKAKHEHLRGIWLAEPRGLVAAFGLLLAPSKSADYGAIFMARDGYLEMCGHATIGLAATLAALGSLQAGRDESFTLEVPAGIVTVRLVWNADGTFRAARITNVPSYVVGDPVLVASSFGELQVDLVHSGMIYALVNARDLGLDLSAEGLASANRIGITLKKEIVDAFATREDLAGSKLHAILFYDDMPDQDGSPAARHLLIVDNQRYDRSPCGTGTAARLTHLVKHGRVGENGSYKAFNIFGNSFDARPVRIEGAQITAEIEGTAHIVAFSNLVLEEQDPFMRGFVSRF